MDVIRTLATLLPLSFTSGINLYATSLVVGLSIRFHWVADAPSNLHALSAWPVIACAAVLYVIEFFADKIQFVDNLWDILHTFIRPIGGALIGLAALGKVDPVLGALGTLAAGGIALTSHSGKASARLALNAASPAENLTNIGLSLLEDVLAGGLAFLALKYPYLAGGIALLLLASIAILTPILLSWVFYFLRALMARLRGLRQGETASDLLPTRDWALTSHLQARLVARCKAQGLPKAGGRNGYLVLGQNELAFTYARWGKSRIWQTGLERIRQVRLRRRMLVDILEVYYMSEQNQGRSGRFIFLKDRSRLAAALAEALRSTIDSPAPTPVEGRTDPPRRLT